MWLRKPWMTCRLFFVGLCRISLSARSCWKGRRKAATTSGIRSRRSFLRLRLLSRGEKKSLRCLWSNFVSSNSDNGNFDVVVCRVLVGYCCCFAEERRVELGSLAAEKKRRRRSRRRRRRSLVGQPKVFLPSFEQLARVLWIMWTELTPPLLL